MNEFLSVLAAGLEPYTPGEQPRDRQYVKLNTNESPYPPSPGVLEAIRRAADSTLRLYPDPDSRAFLEAASEFYDIPVENIFAGNGSDEVLAFAFAAFYSGEEIVFPEVTYSFYPVYCSLFGVSYKELPMVDELKMDTKAMSKSGCGVILPNPNAPTGELVDLRTLRKIAGSNRGRVVIIDEAYIDFGGSSCVSLTEEYENLLVVQTFSKSRSLAGMRIGLAFGSKKLIDGLNRVKNSFNSYPVNRLSQAAAAAAMIDKEYYREMQAKIIYTRGVAVEELRGLGFKVLESSANFIFASHGSLKAGDIYRRLKEKNVLVRYFDKPGIDNYIRITIGTEEQMKILYSSLAKIIKG